MLELVNINKSIGKFSLSNINLVINKGDYYTLLGKSGAGKTMLLEIISGIVKLDSGKIIAQEKLDISQMNSRTEIEENIHRIEHRLYPSIIQKVLEGLL